MTAWNVERHEIRKMLEEEISAALAESLIDKIEDMLTKSFSAGYSYAKNEDKLVDDAAELLSE